MFVQQMERLKWGKKTMEEIAMLNEFLPTQSKSKVKNVICLRGPVLHGERSGLIECTRVNQLKNKDGKSTWETLSFSKP